MSKVVKLLLVTAVILIFYGLYGRIASILDLGYPTYGFNYAIDGFILVSLSAATILHTPCDSFAKLLILFSLTGIISCLSTYSTTVSFIDNVICVIGPISAYSAGYNVSRINQQGQQLPMKLIVAGFIGLVAVYLMSLRADPLSIMLTRDSIFALIFLIPLLALFKKRYLAIALLIISTVIIFFSIKRSAILGLLVSFVIFIILNVFGNKSISSTKKTVTVVLLMLLGFGTYSYFVETETMDHVISRMEDMETDGGSGRDIIYSTVFDQIEKSPVDQLLFGHGFNAVREDLFDHPAHNDLLEIAYDYGIISLVVWCLFIITFLYQALKAMFSGKYYYATLLFSSFILWQIVCETNCIFPNATYTASAFFVFGIINYNLKK